MFVVSVAWLLFYGCCDCFVFLFLICNGFVFAKEEGEEGEGEREGN